MTRPTLFRAAALGMILLVPAAVLAQDVKPEEVRAVLRECRDVLHDPRTTPVERANAVAGLGRYPDPRTAAGLGDILLRADPPVRPIAAWVLGTFTGVEGASRALLTALDHRANRDQAVTRVAIVEALANLRDRAALPAIHRLIRGRDPVSALAAVRTVLLYEEEASIKVLIDALERAEREAADPPILAIPMRGWVTVWVRDTSGERRAKLLLAPIRSALQEATGICHTRHRDWIRWWNAEGIRFRFPKREDEPTP